MTMVNLEWDGGNCYEVAQDGTRTLLHEGDRKTIEKEIQTTATEPPPPFNKEEPVDEYMAKYDQWLTKQIAKDEQRKVRLAGLVARRKAREEAARLNAESKAKYEKDKAAGTTHLHSHHNHGHSQFDEHNGWSGGNSSYSSSWDRKLIDGVDPKKWRRTWWWLLKFTHCDTYHKDTKWEPDYGPGKKYKTWVEWQNAMGNKTSYKKNWE